MAKETRKKLILLDSHAILHRAYHALPDFTSSKDEPTGALYGVIALLLKVIREMEPDYLVACYDLPEPTFRHKEYKAYKAGRKEVDEALVAQIIRSKDIFKAFGIPIYEKAGFEADDIIGTIAEQCKDKGGIQTIIASGDMDTLQLVDEENTSVYTLRKGISDTVIYNKKAVIDRYGFEPKYLPDFKGLSGDKSDNIPGIVGIGEKSATILIQSFGTVEEIYEKLEKKEADFEKKGIKPRVVNLITGHEEDALFSKELGTIRRDVPIEFKVPEKTFWENIKKEQVESFFDELEFRTLKVRFLGLLGEEEGEGEDQKTEETKQEEIPEEDLKKSKIALWLLNSELTSATLDDIYEHTGVKSFKKARKILEEQIKEGGLSKIYDLELSIIPIIKKAEDRGVLIDTKYFTKLSADYHKQLESYEKKIWKLAGVEFNMNSPKQLGEVLFGSMGIPTKGIKKTAGGAISTRESELEKLRGEYEIIDQILGYRALQKLLSTYIDNIPKMVDGESRLHTTLNQTGTTTGRMSSTNPNLQNIPVREGLGEAVRAGFIATPGFVLGGFDYSQIEMRILAELSGDEHLRKTFKEGRDVHSSVASRVFGVTESEVTKDQRRKAKVINFGIVYGMGVRALKQNLSGTMEEAKEFYDAYFREFPKISEYFETVKKEAREKGYTETLYGRKRHFPEITSHVPYVRAAAERMAVNAPVQGTATGDLVKMAMLQVSKKLNEKKLAGSAFLLLQVHDELIYEIKEEHLDEVVGLVKVAMEGVGDLSVPLLVEPKVGSNWGELK